MDALRNCRWAVAPSVEEEEYRSLVPLKGFLARERTQTVNRLRALYTQTGITDLKKSSLAKAESREKQVARLSEPLRDMARILERQIQIYEERLGELGERTGQKVRSHELAPYVLPVPGAGMGIASAFPAYAGAGSRFNKPPEAANYAGLVPRADCSGDTDRYGYITKAGYRPLRAVVLQTPQSLLRAKEGGRLQTKFHGLNGRMGKTKSAAAAVRRLVCLLWILVMRREFYSGLSREGLVKRFHRYKIAYEGWGLTDNRPAS
jgi:transposase